MPRSADEYKRLATNRFALSSVAFLEIPLLWKLPSVHDGGVQLFNWIARYINTAASYWEQSTPQAFDHCCGFVGGKSCCKTPVATNSWSVPPNEMAQALEAWTTGVTGSGVQRHYHQGCRNVERNCGRGFRFCKDFCTADYRQRMLKSIKQHGLEPVCDHKDFCTGDYHNQMLQSIKQHGLEPVCDHNRDFCRDYHQRMLKSIVSQSIKQHSVSTKHHGLEPTRFCARRSKSCGVRADVRDIRTGGAHEGWVVSVHDHSRVNHRRVEDPGFGPHSAELGIRCGPRECIAL